MTVATFRAIHGSLSIEVENVLHGNNGNFGYRIQGSPMHEPVYIIRSNCGTKIFIEMQGTVAIQGLKPTQGGIIIMRTGINKAIPLMIKRQIRICSPVSPKGKLQHIHSRKFKFVNEVIDIFIKRP